MGASAARPGLLSCAGRRATGLVRSIRGDPVEGNCGGPGLAVRAQRLAREGLEVLGEAPCGELVQGRQAQRLCPPCLSLTHQGAPEEPGDYRPDGATPVAAGVEPGVEGARGWREGEGGILAAEERSRVQRVHQDLQPTGVQATGYHWGEARDGAHPRGCVPAEIVVQAKIEFRG